MMVIILIASIIFVGVTNEDIILFTSTVCIITSITSIVRLRIWKGNFMMVTSDPLWRVLLLKKQEEKYQYISLKHAKISSLIANATFVTNAICFLLFLIT